MNLRAGGRVSGFSGFGGLGFRVWGLGFDAWTCTQEDD